MTVRNVELHFHTSPASPCAWHSPKAMLEAAAGAGLDVVCITDHGTLAAHRSLRPEDLPAGVTVLPAVEVSLAVKETSNTPLSFGFGFGADVLVIADDIEVIEHLELEGQAVTDVESIFPAFPKERWLAVWAHPGGGLHKDGSWNEHAARLLELVDAVELRNGARGDMAAHSPEIFVRAKELGKSFTGGSDAHGVREVGTAWNELREDARTARDVIAALRAGAFDVRLREPNWRNDYSIRFTDGPDYDPFGED